MKKLLIVEDEVALREAFSMLFKSQNYDVYEASNGKEAIALITSKKLDIILLDILMPVMGGIEFLEKAEPKKNYPKVKILALTNLSDKKTINRISELGATKYLLKASASPKELLAAVNSL